MQFASKYLFRLRNKDKTLAYDIAQSLALIIAAQLLINIFLTELLKDEWLLLTAMSGSGLAGFNVWNFGLALLAICSIFSAFGSKSNDKYQQENFDSNSQTSTSY